MEPSQKSAPIRTFRPLYQSNGDVMRDKLAFFHLLEELKTQKRTGWVNNKIPHPESIGDHMYRMAILALCTEDTTLDIAKCVMLAVVHDLAEAQVGDITPDEGFTKEEKKKLEEDAMTNIATEMLHDSSAAQRILALWQEYETQESREARFVKDLDRIEMALQAREYEKRYNRDMPDMDLQPFFDSSIPKLQEAEIKSWGECLQGQRNSDR
ncbi:hypothetical protein CPB86DRAFT_723691 [Serendipita vermifera]|nr:hypothetical protein CPB86DRAFT_723691 [Serendipita vermifera]